jgi:arabinofuranan 3-O-arabinosyltransferase
VVNENFNAGWQARAGRRLLRAVRIDGWKQGWLLPAGTAGTVILTYLPDTRYRQAIFGGLGTLGLVMLVALWPGQPAWRPRWLRRVRLPGWRAIMRRRATGRGAEPADAPEVAGPVTAVAVVASPAAAEPESVNPAPAEPGTAESPPPAPGATSSRAADRRGARPAGSPFPLIRGRPGRAAVLSAAAAVCWLALAGLWLGGYPGAAILPAAAALFAVAVEYRHAHPWWRELSRPWVPAALLMAAAACGVVAGQLVLGGATGPVITTLTDTAPQVLCLVVASRLAVALVVGDP